MKQPYEMSVEAIVKELQTNPKTGLTTTEVKERQKKFGLNVLPSISKVSVIGLFLNQFKSPLIYILLFAALIIFFIGKESLDAFIITGVLLFNAVIGTIQEWRLQHIIESLNRLIKTKSIVIRDGKQQVIEDVQLVPGDIIVLQEGERIPADARVIQSNNVTIDEAVLTGESQVVLKTTEPLVEKVSVADRTNMVYKGTFVRTGSGKAIVVAIGLDTEIGKIQRSVEKIAGEIPLQKQLRTLSYWILIFVFISCIVLFLIGLLTGRTVQELLVMIAALFICVIPEGLPVVLTLTLVRGAYLMAQKKVLARNLLGVEGLGRTDVIITDKTGTLTRNELVATRVWDTSGMYSVTGEGYFTQGVIYTEAGKETTPQPGQRLYEIGVACALLNTSELSYDPKLKLFEIKGDPTEAALYVLAQKMGLTRTALEKNYTLRYEIPFDPMLKIHAAFYEYNDEVIAFIIGAPEALMARSTQPIQTAEKALGDLLAQGLRVVAVGQKKVQKSAVTFDRQSLLAWLQDGVTVLGLCGIEDAIRPEVRTVIEQARSAGLRVVMATGDHKKTAHSVAEKVGLFKKGDRIVDGKELQEMSDVQLLDELYNITVFARVSPEDKTRIVDLYHKRGKIVAMTGDGINDVPSLVGADVGIAMGSIGTEVAKHASDLVLLDDSFVNIINAIQLGRHVFYTLRRVILYFFSTNMAEMLAILFVLATKMPFPFTAVQILWVNFVTDGFLDVGISMEPQEAWLLRADWLKRKPKLFDWGILAKMMFLAVPMALGTIIIYWWVLSVKQDLYYARTMALMTLIMYQWFNAWNCRSEGESLVEIGLWTNRWFLLAASFVLSLQAVLLYVPFMQYIFKTVPLSVYDWFLILAITSPIIVLDELRKLITHWWTRRCLIE